MNFAKNCLKVDKFKKMFLKNSTSHDMFKRNFEFYRALTEIRDTFCYSPNAKDVQQLSKRNLETLKHLTMPETQMISFFSAGICLLHSSLTMKLKFLKSLGSQFKKYLMSSTNVVIY